MWPFVFLTAFLATLKLLVFEALPWWLVISPIYIYAGIFVVLSAALYFSANAIKRLNVTIKHA